MRIDSLHVPVKFDTGAVAWIEATPLGQMETEMDTAASAELLGPLETGVLRSAMEGIAKLVHDVIGTINAKRTTVEFGIEFGLEAGKLTALIVQSNSKANLKISVTWE